MWGQALKDEGKVQGALSLWRKSARDFHRNDDDDGSAGDRGASSSPNTVGSTLQLQTTDIADTSTDGAAADQLGNETANFSDGEFLSDSDFAVTPNSRHRKRRGSVTRRR
jgi:hypothetical protein